MKKNVFFQQVMKNPWFLAAVAATLAEGAVRILLASLGGAMVNEASAGNSAGLWYPAAGALALSLLILFCIWGKERLYVTSLEKEVLRIKKNCFARLSGASMASLDEWHRGELGAACLNDINALSASLRPFVIMCFSLVLMRVETVLYMMWKNWFVTAAMLCLSPLILWLQNRIARPVKKYKKESLQAAGIMLGTVSDCFSSAEYIKAASLQKEMEEQFLSCQKAQVEAALRAKRLEAVQGAFSYLAEILPRVLLILAGGYEISRGRMSVGDLMVFVALSSSAARLFKGFADLNIHLQNVRACLERVELKGIRPESENPPDMEGESKHCLKALAFDQVSFGYRSGQPVLNNFSMQVKEGEWIQLAGESGSGKSTVLQLICGFYMPWSGKILVEGLEAGKCGLQEIRSRIAYVPQEPYLLPVSVYENIACGRAEQISRSRAEELLRQVGLGSWLDGLDRGLDTLLDGHETALSGGQKQRIAIARGLAKGSRIILLDEVTSGLDRETERKVYETFQQELAGLTVLLVTHNELEISGVRRIDVGRCFG